MASLDDVRAVAAETVARAERELAARGVGPCPRLLEALERGVEQLVVARALGEDVASRQRYLHAVYGRLAAAVPVDEVPEPARRTSNVQLLDPDWRSRQARCLGG